MPKKNDKLLEKLVKKDFNNELERVLEKKYFNESTKNLLLSILYKLEISYKDYKQVKQNVGTKEEIIENVIKNVKNNCEEIKLIRPNSEESEILHGKTFLVDKKRKLIFCYPIERKLLYSISKISKKDKIIQEKYFLIDETLSDLINIGNNISTVEPLRDFNGYSWNTISKEIESIEYNLIYQLLLILVGNRFIERWINNKEVLLDYMEKFTNNMEEKYGPELGKAFVKQVEELSILLAIKHDRNKKRKIVKIKNEIDDKLYEIEDNRTFIIQVAKEKRKLEAEIKKIDKTINDKQKLQKEYDKRNQKLQLKEKIFSMRVLAQMMKEERRAKIERLNYLNRLLNPEQFLEYKKDLINKGELLQVLDTKSLEQTFERKKIENQKIFLECFRHKINKTRTKPEMLRLIYEFRYYAMLPYNEKQQIREVENLKENIIEVEKEILKKAHNMKIIEKLSKQEEIDYELLKSIFNTRTINLEEICVKLEKNKKGEYFVQVFDGKICEEQRPLEKAEQMNKKDLYLRFNKKVRIFI